MSHSNQKNSTPLLNSPDSYTKNSENITQDQSSQGISDKWDSHIKISNNNHKLKLTQIGKCSSNSMQEQSLNLFNKIKNITIFMICTSKIHLKNPISFKLFMKNLQIKYKMISEQILT